MSFYDPDLIYGPQGTVNPRGGVQTWRRTASGVTELLIQDPDNRSRSIWVPALWNPAIDLLVPIDPKYRAPGETYPAQRWGHSFADSNGGMDFDVGLLPATATAGNSGSTFPMPSLARPESSDNSGVLLLVAAAFAIYLISS